MLDPVEVEVARKALRRFPDQLEAVRKTLPSAKLLRFRNNQTGSQTILMFKLGRASLKVGLDTRHVTEYGQGDWATNGVRDRIWQGLVPHFGLDGLKDVYKGLCLSHGLTGWWDGIYLSTALRELVPEFEAFEELVRETVLELQWAGSHQGGLALRNMRACVVKALRNGLSREDLIRVVDEECVRGVLES
jgi:hypothetical protein